MNFRVFLKYGLVFLALLGLGLGLRIFWDFTSRSRGPSPSDIRRRKPEGPGFVDMGTKMDLLMKAQPTLLVDEYETYPLNPDLDRRLRGRLSNLDIRPLRHPQPPKRSRVQLGWWLFWDRDLSGDRRMSCGNCHTQSLGLGDGLSLSIGTGARGDSLNRTLAPEQEFVPRNSPSLFNVGLKEWKTMFWDKRIRLNRSGELITPVGKELPDGIETPLEAQALFPMVTGPEMKGDNNRSIHDVFGVKSKVATTKSRRQAWETIRNRILSNEIYKRYFRQAFPETPLEDMTMTHIAKVIADYETQAFTYLDNPWDHYLRRNPNVLSPKAKRGALLFFGKAKCHTCHAGPLFSDQETYNIGVPQLGPGVPPHEPYDMGRYNITGNSDDKFSFRTPPLRNVGLTGPWMHNGAYKSLEGAVRHHFSPEESLKHYNAQQLGRDIQMYHRSPRWTKHLSQFPFNEPDTLLIQTVKNGPDDRRKILQTLDRQKLPTEIDLNEKEFNQLMEFLFSLTSPSLIVERDPDPTRKDAYIAAPERRKRNRMTEYIEISIPDTVPSGLPVAGCNAQWCR